MLQCIIIIYDENVDISTISYIGLHTSLTPNPHSLQIIPLQIKHVLPHTFSVEVFLFLHMISPMPQLPHNCVLTSIHLSIHTLWLMLSGVATGGEGSRPTSVHTPLGISANPLKSYFFIWGIPFPYMYIVAFTAHQQRNMVQTPHFLGLAMPLLRISLPNPSQSVTPQYLSYTEHQKLLYESIMCP